MSAEECYPVEDKPFVTDDAAIEFSQSVRKNLVKRMTTDGTVPNDPESQKVLLQALHGISTTALGRKKIKSDEKVGNGLSAMGGVMAAMLQQASDPRLFQSKNGQLGTIKTLGADIPDPVLVEGETSAEPAKLSYDSFMVDPTQESQPTV